MPVLKMHQVECISVDSTGISIYLYKAEVRWYRLSLSVVVQAETVSSEEN